MIPLCFLNRRSAENVAEIKSHTVLTLMPCYQAEAYEKNETFICFIGRPIRDVLASAPIGINLWISVRIWAGMGNTQPTKFVFLVGR